MVSYAIWLRPMKCPPNANHLWEVTRVIYTDRIGRQRAAATIRSNGVGGGIYSMASADVEARDQRMKPGDVSLVGWVR